ncbi:MAG: alkaline phosphatase [Carboxylicivirga sp.]|nr:alkaline phosphatase [Carboxylicivirga sp.]
MKNYKIVFSALLLVFATLVSAQENYKTDKSLVSTEYDYQSSEGVYNVPHFEDVSGKKKPKNIILLIGDGMGVAQVHAAMTANGGKLFMNNFKKVGFSKTHSADKYVTDSAAGGTALSAGKKTNNKAVGIDENGNLIENVREFAEQKGKATGVVSTSAVTHATPASFVAHQPQRSMYEAIAADFLKTDIDVFIGGGLDHFIKREDKRNLKTELEAKDYQVVTSVDELKTANSPKLAALLAPTHMDKMPARGDVLPLATKKAVELLSQNKKGFFLMVEGSQIDWGGHQNNTEYVVRETLDFDKAVGEALAFAAENKNTLVIVTSDHETGGMVINNGSYDDQLVKGHYGTKGHSGIMVPVFAYGPGADNFTGIQDNTDIGKMIFKLLGKK